MTKEKVLCPDPNDYRTVPPILKGESNQDQSRSTIQKEKKSISIKSNRSNEINCKGTHAPCRREQRRNHSTYRKFVSIVLKKIIVSSRIFSEGSKRFLPSDRILERRPRAECLFERQHFAKQPAPVSSSTRSVKAFLVVCLVALKTTLTSKKSPISG